MTPLRMLARAGRFRTAGTLQMLVRAAPGPVRMPARTLARTSASTLPCPSQRRAMASFAGQTPPTPRSAADEIVDRLQELYATARDEFEIAAEETTKNTTYAASDRAAAREALDELKLAYAEATSSSGEAAVADQVRTRVGHRLRELENAVDNLEALAHEM